MTRVEEDERVAFAQRREPVRTSTPATVKSAPEATKSRLVAALEAAAYADRRVS